MSGFVSTCSLLVAFGVRKEMFSSLRPHHPLLTPCVSLSCARSLIFWYLIGPYVHEIIVRGSNSVKVTTYVFKIPTDNLVYEKCHPKQWQQCVLRILWCIYDSLYVCEKSFGYKICIYTQATSAIYRVTCYMYRTWIYDRCPEKLQP